MLAGGNEERLFCQLRQFTSVQLMPALGDLFKPVLEK